MSDRDIIPDRAIDIVQFPKSKIDFSNGRAFPVPVVSHGFIEISLDNQYEIWITSLDILVSVEVKITINYHTDKKCTNQSTGNITYVYLHDKIIRYNISADIPFRETFATLKENNLPAFCGESLKLRVSAVDPLASADSVFKIALKLNGFILDTGICGPLSYVFNDMINK